MNCCSIPNDLDKMFDTSVAHDDAERYHRNGIDKHARRVVAALTAEGVSGASVLEVGSGVGGLHLELLKSGAAQATSVDLSPAYVAAATDVAARLGFQARTDHRLLDFARQADEVPAADVVVLHRVVCCYPDMRALVRPAADHARRLLALTFPRDVWWLRLGNRLLNGWLALTRSAYRFFVHSPAEIVATVAAAGLSPVAERRSGPWLIVVFRRAGV